MNVAFTLATGTRGTHSSLCSSRPHPLSARTARRRLHTKSLVLPRRDQVCHKQTSAELGEDAPCLRPESAPPNTADLWDGSGTGTRHRCPTSHQRPQPHRTRPPLTRVLTGSLTGATQKLPCLNVPAQHPPRHAANSTQAGRQAEALQSSHAHCKCASRTHSFVEL